MYLLAIIWIILAFYLSAYLRISFADNKNDFKEFVILIIATINLLVLSKNLFTILFFYICLIIECNFFSQKFLNFDESKLTKFFSFSLYIESFLIFLAMILTFKTNSQLEFVENIIVPLNYNENLFKNIKEFPNHSELILLSQSNNYENITNINQDDINKNIDYIRKLIINSILI